DTLSAVSTRSALVAVVAFAACASPNTSAAPMRATDFNPRQIRQPAIFVAITIGNGLSPRDGAELTTIYEGVLVEGFNARAVLPRGVRGGGEGRLDAQAALARAREIGADHAVLIRVSVARGDRLFCREARRPVRGAATTWQQEADVLRVSDGARRAALGGEGLEVTDADVDCNDPRASRRRSTDETVSDAVNRLLTRLLGSS